MTDVVYINYIFITNNPGPNVFCDAERAFK